MLTKPNCGWTQITINDFSERAFCLTDIPFNFLEGFIECKEQGHGKVLCDAHGWEYTIYIYPRKIFVSNEGSVGENVKYAIEVSADSLARELLRDIRSDVDGWTAWVPDYGKLSRKLQLERKRDLLKKCLQLEKLL